MQHTQLSQVFAGLTQADPLAAGENHALVLDAAVGVVEPGAHSGGVCICEWIKQACQHVGAGKFHVVVEQQQMAAAAVGAGEVVEAGEVEGDR